MTVSSLGIGSGLDLQSLLDGLMRIETAQQNALRTKVTVNQNKVTQYQALNTKMLAVKSAGEALNLGSYWKINKATSSDSSVIATADSTALPGSLAFTVASLATANVRASFGSVASTDTVVGTGSMLVGKGGALGIAGLSGSGLALGTHTLEVTQASSGAGVSGTPLANSITLNGTETIDVSVNGTPRTFTLTAGTYNQQSLASMLDTVSGGQIDASVNSNKSLRLTTTREGSASSIQVTGGTGLAALGLSAGAAVNGTDGIIKVDGVFNTVTDIRPDGSNTAVLNSSAGTVATTFSSGLRVGSSTVKNIDLGDGKLSTVVTAINNASTGVTAAAVQVAPGQFKLQMQSGTTGTVGAISADFSAFSSTLGDLDTATAATDAKIQVGTGVSAYTVTSSSNAVTGMLPGVTLKLTTANPSNIINVTVGGDADALADKVSAMITAANDANAYIKSNSKYDVQSKSAGPLLSNSTAQRLARDLFSNTVNPVTGSTLGASNVGIKTDQSGVITFDKEAFKAAYATNPAGVAALFVEGGTTGITTGTNPGIAERLLAAARGATDTTTGSLTTSIAGVNKTIADLNNQIDDWDVRLAARQKTLKRQFSSLDTAIAGFKSQQARLTGQIGGLAASNGR